MRVPSFSTPSLIEQIFHPTEPRVIGILDWELCTLGSPLADLGNLLLPFSFAPIRDPDHVDTLRGGGAGSKGPKRADMALLVGLKGMSTTESGLPQREEIEEWWVKGMNDGARWHRARGKGEAGDSDDWRLPIQGMG